MTALNRGSLFAGMHLRSWLVVSVTLNVVLLLALASGRNEPESAPAGSSRALASSSGEVVATVVPKAEAPSHGERPSLIGLRDTLRAAGVAPEQIEQVLRGVQAKERMRAKRATSWWKGSPYSSDLRFVDPMETHREQEELRQLVGETSFLPGVLRDVDLSHVAESRRGEVERILRDYAEVHMRHAIGGLRISADQARDELLREELQRDLRAVLTEEEYVEHTLRDVRSSEWARLRMDAEAMNLTEAEFRETAKALLVARSIADEAARMQAVEKVHTDLRARVGEERIFEARAKNSREFSQLRQAQVRFGFPQAATDRVVTAWHETFKAAEALRAESADRTKQADAWRALAVETREKVVAALGSEAGGAYLEQSMHWLHEWDRGLDTRTGGIVSKR